MTDLSSRGRVLWRGTCYGWLTDMGAADVHVGFDSGRMG